MMKYTAIVLLGLVALAAAGPIAEGEFDNEIAEDAPQKASVWRLFPADEAEKSKVKPGFEAAADFCVASRDHVKNYIVSSLNSGAASVFSKFFDIFSEVTQEALDAQKKAAAEGVELIKKGDAVEIPAVEEGAEPTKQMALVAAGRQIFVAIISALTKKSQDQISQVVDSLKGENARQHILNTCATIQVGLKRDLDNQWSQFRKSKGLTELKGQANSVGCVTVNRIYAIDNMCTLLNAAQGAIFPIFNL